MSLKIKEEVIKQILLPKKDKLIKQLIDFINNDIQKLVIPDVRLTVVNFIHDLPFEFRYVVLPDSRIIDNQFQTHFHAVIDYSNFKDSEIMHKILSNYAKEYENREVDENELYEWASDWESENKEVEYRFFSDCWMAAKKVTNSNLRGVIFEHECWSDSYELDDGLFLDQEKYIDYLMSKGIPIKSYK